MSEQPEGTVDTSTTPKPKGSRARQVLSPEYEHTSRNLDSSIDDIDTFEVVRRQEVSEALAYFDQVRKPLQSALQQPLRIMEGKDADPYYDLRLPDNLSVVSLSDLQHLAARASNAYLTYGEWLSAARSLASMRGDVHERRKHRAMLNEGGNDMERKALASMRSEPEFLMLSRVNMVKDWIETRYFMYQRIVETISQMMTTKSVEATRQMKDAEHEGRSY